MSVRSKPNRAPEATIEASDAWGELPVGWALCRFDSIAELNPRHASDFDDAQLVTFLPMPCLSDSSPDFDRSNERPLKEVRKGYTHFADGDVLFAKITPCMENGKGAVATGLKNRLGCGTTELHVIRPLDEVDPYYIYRFLQQESVRRDAAANFTGSAGQLRVPLSFIAELQIPLPPLAEQQRIVVKLEEVLGKVSSSQQRLARIPALLKRFRQSVLAAACSGKLTADWREVRSGPPIDSSVEIEIPATFPIIPENWNWASLEEVCARIVDCPHSTPKWTDRGKLCLRTTNFRPGFLDLGEVRFVSTETFNARIERLRPESGDVVYSREGGILGVACQIPPSIELCLGQRMMLFRVGSKYTSDLLMHWLNSPVITRRVQELTGGSASPHLNVRDIKAFPTPVPPLPEQLEIVRRVEQLFAFADQIEARFKKAQAQVERLTQSVLAKAFRGELVPTEAELARRENRPYESASQLLERIRICRESTPETKKGRGKKRNAANSK